MTKQKPQVSTVQDPPVNDPKRAEYTPPEAKERRGSDKAKDANSKPQGKDHVYGVESRARWADSDSGTLNEMIRDTKSIESGEANAAEGEEEEEEEGDAFNLTVAQLKEALDAAKIDYPGNAKKADLVQLYSDNDLG